MTLPRVDQDTTTDQRKKESTPTAIPTRTVVQRTVKRGIDIDMSFTPTTIIQTLLASSSITEDITKIMKEDMDEDSLCNFHYFLMLEKITTLDINLYKGICTYALATLDINFAIITR